MLCSTVFSDNIRLPLQPDLRAVNVHMEILQEAAVFLHSTLRERGASVGTAVVECRPGSFTVLPDHQVLAEQLVGERRRWGGQRSG